MPELSVIIPARNEWLLSATVENILAQVRGDTEVICVCDGCWPDPPVQNHPRVKVIYHPESVGQRAATNDGARLSRAKYVMKVDAHCAFDEGFDVKLMQDCQPDWTMIPQMYNLHAFDWECTGCGHRTYQGSRPPVCVQCGCEECVEAMVWLPRWNRLTVSWMFDKDMHFQYWRKHAKRPESQVDLLETMSCIGCCFFMERDRFWELGGMDEAHGSWGQFGTELACKAWLSGGKMVTSKRTWLAHMFRTGNFSADGSSSFPYYISGDAQERARQYSRDLWLNDKWPGARHKLSWLVEKFRPVPTWHEGAK